MSPLDPDDLMLYPDGSIAPPPDAVVLTVHQALTAVMHDVGVVPKDSTGQGVNYKFQGIAAILAKVQPAFVRHGVVMTPHRIVHHSQQDRTTKNGGTQVQADLVVEWWVYGPAGDFIEAQSFGHAFDTSDKAFNKAMTAAHKYALKQVLSIHEYEPDEDQDAHRPEAGTRAVEPADRPLGVGAAKTYIVGVLMARSEITEARAKVVAKGLWKDMALDGCGPYTTTFLDETVDAWFAGAEPFDTPTPPPEPPPNVDVETGEVTA